MSIEDLLSQIEDGQLRNQIREHMSASSLDSVFEGCDWLENEADPHRRTPIEVIADVEQRASALSGSKAAKHLQVLVNELKARRARGFGLVWDAESPDNAERLHIPLKEKNYAAFGLDISVGHIVELADNKTDQLYRVSATRERERA